MTLDKILFVAGLAFDIAGAYFLARGIAKKPLESMADESLVGAGGPPNLQYMAGVLEQKADARIGVWLLVVGFSVQSLDYFELFPLWSFPRWSVILGLLILGWILYRLGEWLKRRLRRDGLPLLVYVLRSTEEGRCGREGSDGYVCEAAKWLIPWFGRLPDETDAAFARRVWELVDSSARPSGA